MVFRLPQSARQPETFAKPVNDELMAHPRLADISPTSKALLNAPLSNTSRCRAVLVFRLPQDFSESV